MSALTTQGAPAAAEAPTPAEPRPRTKQLASIDILKALAIVGVLMQHGLRSDVINGLYGNLWILPAVPIFFVLAGLNQGMSFMRSGARRLGDLYTRAFFGRRANRILVPFLLVLAIDYVVAVFQPNSHIASLANIFGGWPTDAPGNYFIPALIGITIVLPAMYVAYRARPLLTLLACFALDAVFEVAAAKSGLTHSVSGFLYDSAFPRFLGMVVLGLWAATDPRLRSRRNLPILLLAVASIAYLLVELKHPGSIPVFHKHGFERRTNFLTAPWAFALVLLGMRFLPQIARGRVSRSLVEIGRASYHVYLWQMLWFGVIGGQHASTPFFAVSLAACLAGGLLFYRLLPDGTAILQRIVWPVRGAVQRARGREAAYADGRITT